ncbi:hypothetical protein H8356DRAFT_1354188 [Neocallimastix lanati (nom. inval.)]|nr:hypothetical protein H8356DRAFT_1354188 [Neocallimastix sp. JGI-2020a]
MPVSVKLKEGIDIEKKMRFMDLLKMKALIFEEPFNLSEAQLRAGFIGNNNVLCIIIRWYDDCAYFVKEKDQNKNFEEQISFYKEMFSSDYEEIRYSKEDKENSATTNPLKSKKISKTVFFFILSSCILSKYKTENKKSSVYLILEVLKNKYHEEEINEVPKTFRRLENMKAYSYDTKLFREERRFNLKNTINGMNAKLVSIIEKRNNKAIPIASHIIYNMPTTVKLRNNVD